MGSKSHLLDRSLEQLKTLSMQYVMVTCLSHQDDCGEGEAGGKGGGGGLNAVCGSWWSKMSRLGEGPKVCRMLTMHTVF